MRRVGTCDEWSAFLLSRWHFGACRLTNAAFGIRGAAARQKVKVALHGSLLLLQVLLLLGVVQALEGGKRHARRRRGSSSLVQRHSVSSLLLR